MHKITNNSIQNRGSNLILNKSGRGPPKKHQHKICNISVHRFKRRSKWVKQRSLSQRVNIGTEYKSAKWHCGRHTLICKKILIKKT